MKEITKIEPTTVIEGEVKEITVFYSTGDPVIFVPETVTVSEPVETVSSDVTSTEPEVVAPSETDTETSN